MPRDGTPDIRVQGLTKRYGDVVAVDAIDLDIPAGEFFTMLGPSGSGKTTTLRMIAGFETPDEGTIELAGEDVSRLPPYDRPVNTVFQDYALFPHMTVQQNVEYGLMVKKIRKNERRERAGEALEMVRLEAYGARKPSQLSGGQRQRSRSPAPSSTARPPPRRAARRARPQAAPADADRAEVDPARGRHHVRVRDARPGEALTMSDRIAVFNEGRIEQVGPPAEVYEHPERVHRRLRRRLERARAGRPPVHDPAGEDQPARGWPGPRPGWHVEPGVVRDVQYVGPVTRF